MKTAAILAAMYVGDVVQAQTPFFYVYKNEELPVACQGGIGDRVPDLCCNFAAGSHSKYQVPFENMFDGSSMDTCSGRFYVFGSSDLVASRYEVASRIIDHGDGTFSYHESCLHEDGTLDCDNCETPVVDHVPTDGCYHASAFPGQAWLFQLPQKPFWYVYDLAHAPQECQGDPGTMVPESCCTLADATFSQYQPAYSKVFGSPVGYAMSNDICTDVFHIQMSSDPSTAVPVAARLIHHGDGTFSYHEGCLMDDGTVDCNACQRPVLDAQPYGCYAANSPPGMQWLIEVPKRPYWFVYETASLPAQCAGGSEGTMMPLECCSLTSGATLTQYQPPFQDVFQGSGPDWCAGPFHIYVGPDRDTMAYPVGARLIDHRDGTFTYHEGCLHQDGTMDCDACDAHVVEAQPYGCYQAGAPPDQTWLVLFGQPVASQSVVPARDPLEGMTCGTVRDRYGAAGCCGMPNKIIGS